MLCKEARLSKRYEGLCVLFSIVLPLCQTYNQRSDQIQILSVICMKHIAVTFAFRESQDMAGRICSRQLLEIPR